MEAMLYCYGATRKENGCRVPIGSPPKRNSNAAGDQPKIQVADKKHEHVDQKDLDLGLGRQFHKLLSFLLFTPSVF
jgi:hypothetical protein